MKYKIKKTKKKINKFKKKFLKIIDDINNIKYSIIKFFKEPDKLKKIGDLIKKIVLFLSNKKIFRVIIVIIPLILMDLVLRIIHGNNSYFPFFSISPRIFSISYIILFIGLIFYQKRKYGLICYTIIFLLFYILFNVNGIYYFTTGNYFGMNLISLFGEGSSYFLDSLRACPWYFYLSSLVILGLFIYGYYLFPKRKKTSISKIISVIIVFLILRFNATIFLGKGNFELTWDSWQNPRNVYDNFNDSNKCISISGFFEYTIRDFYVTYIKKVPKKSESENSFLEEIFVESNSSYSKNQYTGIFKDKNVIFLQLEGIDNWLLTKEVMPNTYALLNNSINFTNHYSFYNGGGSTFNSEFAVNTGYMTPFTYIQNAYSLNKNDFPYTMANIMKNNNYYVKAFHMNSSEYYSRGINYQNWGYDQYFSLKDSNLYKDTSYYLDRELIINEKFYNELFKSEGKFVNYIITYSTHMPFNATRGSSVCNLLLNIDYEDKLKDMNSSLKNEFLDNLQMTEEDCVKRQAKETDYFVSLLIKGLKDNNLYNNTVLVVFTDHYLYSLSDQDILDKYKDTETNLINKTPFFIWSSDLRKMEVAKVTSQLNILPTFLNLMGIKYNENWYVSKDALGKSYNPIAIFSDLSWYDGNLYVVDGIIKNNKKVNIKVLETKNNYVEYLIKKNDLVLKYNYFKEISN